MATTEHEGGTGSKFRKRQLRRVLSTPVDRQPLAVRGIYGPPPETEAGGSRWFSKLADPASRVIVRGASRLLSVFGKGLAATPGGHINAIEVAPEVKSSPEPGGEHSENPVDVCLSIHNNGSDGSKQELFSRNDPFFELEQQLKQKRFSSAEIDRLTELLHSRIIEPSTLPSTDNKNKGKINEDSSINSSSSQRAVNHEKKEKANTSELEGQMEQLFNLHGNVTSGVHVNISEEGFESTIEIARAYMGLKPRITAPSTLGLQSKLYQRDKASPLILQLGNKPSNDAITSRSVVRFPVPADSGNDCMTLKPPGRSASSKLSRSPHCRPFMMTKPGEYSYKDSIVEPRRSLEWTPSSSNIRHSSHGQALKRGSSDRDAGCFSDARRVRQKSCLKDLNLSTHTDTSSTFILGQEYKHGIDLKSLDNLDGRIPSTNIRHVPPHSMEMARKILHQLDKLNPSPKNKSSEKKVIVGDASFKSSLSASHVGSLKFKGNNDSTKLLNVGGSRHLEDPSSSDLARITNSASPNEDKAEGKTLLVHNISGAKVASCSGMNSSVISAIVANHGMKSMDSNSHESALISMRKGLTVQNVPDDKVESTKAEHAILFAVNEPREKFFEHSLEYVPTSGLLHADSDTGASNKAYTLADDATAKKEDSVSPFKFGSKVSTYNANPLSAGISARVKAGCSSAVSSSTGNGAPKFQFGTGNSTCYSFTGVSAVSSITGVGVCTPVFSFFHPHSEGIGSLSTSTVSTVLANGVFGVNTSSTFRNFSALTASSSGTQGISSGNGAPKFFT